MSYPRLPLPMHLMIVDYANGLAGETLALKYGCSGSTSWFRLKELGINVTNKLWPTREHARRASNYRTNFGITLHDYEKLFLVQKGLCLLCGKADSVGRRLAVDHCHKTGKIRGLLCTLCNCGLGNFRDDEGLLTKAIDYLRKYK